MSMNLKEWKWYSIEYSYWIDGVESAHVRTDVIERSMVHAQRQFSQTQQYQHTIYGVHYLGTAEEYFAKLHSLAEVIIGPEDDGGVGGFPVL